MNNIIKSAMIIFFLSGCATFDTQPKAKKTLTYEEYVLKKVRNADYSRPYADVKNIYQNLNGAIVAIADQLLISNIEKSTNTSLILTSFVNLNKFHKTSTFGRLVSESMFNELHIRKFKITDFRGQDAVSVNSKGEFHLTRQVDKLRDHIEATEYLVVGTYVRFENDTVLINARIIDSETGAVVSTARVIYSPKDCKLFNHDGICKEDRELRPVNFGIDIVPDNCTGKDCNK
jgi:TolB-like protein